LPLIFIGSSAANTVFFISKFAVGMLYRARTVTPTSDAFVVATPEKSVAAGTETRGDDAERTQVFGKRSVIVWAKPLTLMVIN
jgi:hypothetical protein